MRTERTASKRKIFLIDLRLKIVSFSVDRRSSSSVRKKTDGRVHRGASRTEHVAFGRFSQRFGGDFVADGRRRNVRRRNRSAVHGESKIDLLRVFLSPRSTTFQVVQPAIVQSTDLSSGLEKTLDFIRTECKAMLYVVERINRECGSHFDFVVHSIMPELIQCLQNSSQFLFFAADPEIFHQRYSAWLNFLDQFKRLLSKSSEENLLQSKIYREFAQKWDLVVYFQIRFQSIAIGLEQILLDQPFVLLGGEWKTLIVEKVYRSIEQCWDEKIFLEPLAHQFWKLSLQCLVRLRTWIETLQVKTSETKFYVHLYVDLQRFATEAQSFFERVVLGQRFAALVSANVQTELSSVFQQTLTNVVQTSREILKKLIVQRLIDQCQESIQAVRDIPRMYRKTNRDVIFNSSPSKISISFSP